MRTRVLLSMSFVCTCLVGAALAQSEHVQRTLVVNGQSGSAIVYHIDGKSYVELETLVRIANGAISFEGNSIVLTLPAAQESTSSEVPTHSAQDDSALSSDFMRTSIESLGAIKDWVDTLTYAAQRGVPGDGSRIVLLQNRATQTLLIAKTHAIANSDQNALQLLTNNFNALKAWSDKLIGERRSMDSGKYSVSPDLIDHDETYQKIVACTKFLTTMLTNGQFQDERSCH